MQRTSTTSTSSSGAKKRPAASSTNDDDDSSGEDNIQVWELTEPVPRLDLGIVIESQCDYIDSITIRNVPDTYDFGVVLNYAEVAVTTRVPCTNSTPGKCDQRATFGGTDHPVLRHLRKECLKSTSMDGAPFGIGSVLPVLTTIGGEVDIRLRQRRPAWKPTKLIGSHVQIEVAGWLNSSDQGWTRRTYTIEDKFEAPDASF